MDNDRDDEALLVTYGVVGFTVRDTVIVVEYDLILVLGIGVSDDDLDTECVVVSVGCWELLGFDVIDGSVGVTRELGD